MTNEPLPDTWHNRDLPVLRVVVRLCDERPGELINMSEVVQLTGLDERDVVRAGLALESAGLLKTIGDFSQRISDFHTPGARARQLTGSWPTAETGADRLVAALEKLASNAPDEPTRTRAQGALAQLGGFSRDTLAAIAATVITGQLPGSGS
jgi:hypothetical protein